MEHRVIIRALCHSAMANPTRATRQQVARLRDALSGQGEDREAEYLTSLLGMADRRKELQTARSGERRAGAASEHLGPITPVPVDCETSVPLADMVFPDEGEGKSPLLDEVITDAVMMIIEEWTNRDQLLPIGMDPPMSILLYGASGTGKTCLGLWIAREIGLPVVSARVDGMVSASLGATVRNIGNLFRFANRHGCVLLLDEFDAIARLRDDTQEVGEIKRVVNALLQNLDERSGTGLTIGITNHERLLDPAIWRRFEVQVAIPVPDFETRVAIARQHVLPVEALGSHVRMMGWLTRGQTGAEVEMLARTYRKWATRGGSDHGGLVEVLQRFCILNSARVDPDRSEVLCTGNRELALLLREDHETGFTMTEIAGIIGRDKSTVSRWLNPVGRGAGER